MFHLSDKCPFVYEKFENFSPKIKQKFSNPKTCMEGSQLTSFIITVEKGMEEEMEKSVVEGFGGNEVELVKVVERVEKFVFEKGKEERRNEGRMGGRSFAEVASFNPNHSRFFQHCQHTLTTFNVNLNNNINDKNNNDNEEDVNGEGGDDDKREKEEKGSELKENL